MEKDSATADEIYEQLQGVPVLNGFFGQCSARILGLLTHTMGEHAAAGEHFEDSLEFCRNAGYKPELAWTCSDYAEMLLERNAPSDREKATELKDEAIAIAQELGMEPLIERVLAQREILKA